jgi:hypothetical protein
VLRGTVIYFVLLALLRLMPRRTVGSLRIIDLLVAVLIAEAAGKAMGEYGSVTDGIVLVATLLGGVTFSTGSPTTCLQSTGWSHRERCQWFAMANCRGATCAPNSSLRRSWCANSGRKA